MKAFAMHKVREMLTGPHVFLHCSTSSSNRLLQSDGSRVGKFGGVVITGIVSVHGLIGVGIVPGGKSPPCEPLSPDVPGAGLTGLGTGTGTGRGRRN